MAALGVSILALASIRHGLAFTSLCGAMAGSHPRTVKHVMIIVDENRSYQQVIGSPSTLGDPYINNVLAPSCGLATNYHNFSHPSLPNYLALTSGAAKGPAGNTDCPVVRSCPQTQDSIFSQLGNARRSWRQYSGRMPSNCQPAGSYRSQRVMYALAPYYISNPVPSECRKWDVLLGTPSSGALFAALSPTTDRLPAFSFVAPGYCNNMHSCPTSAGDRWLQTWIPIIQKSAAYQNGQLVVFITWDEGSGADDVAGEHCWDSAHANSSLYPSCRVATLVLSPYTKPRTRTGSYFNHLNLLATIEGMLGLPRIATTSGCYSLRSAFGL